MYSDQKGQQKGQDCLLPSSFISLKFTSDMRPHGSVYKYVTLVSKIIFATAKMKMMKNFSINLFSQALSVHPCKRDFNLNGVFLVK